MPPPSGDGQWHLYNLANDLGESRDVQLDYPDIFAELKSDYAAYVKEVGIAELGDHYNPSPSCLGLCQQSFGFPMALCLGRRDGAHHSDCSA